jgi:hypothetical protein
MLDKLFQRRKLVTTGAHEVHHRAERLVERRPLGTERSDKEPGLLQRTKRTIDAFNRGVQVQRFICARAVSEISCGPFTEPK